MKPIDKASAGCASDEIGSRRSFLRRGIAAWALVAAAGRSSAATVSSPKRSATVTTENFSPSGVSQGKSELERVTRSDEQWRMQLSRASYQVTRHAGTEPAFSGEYAESHGDGLYRCICCDTALFDSRTKFESGTGWPSFWQPISRVNVSEEADDSYGMHRTAVTCRRCDAHLGHVFDDGPKPTGLRYCMNSVALKFIRRA